MSHEDPQAHDRSAPAPRGPLYWRRIEDLAGEDGPVDHAREFEDGADELVVDPLSRRTFLGLMGASLALAGLGTTGCDMARKPAQEILPFSRRPEDLVPGNAMFFATSAWIGGSVLGLLVESQEGRPTKIEGNPLHPNSRGAASAFAQAEVLALYDPDRSTQPWAGSTRTSWDAAWQAITARFPTPARDAEGIAVVVDARPSPTLHRLLLELQARRPGIRVHVHDSAARRNAAAGARLVGMDGQAAVLRLAEARAIVALDADILLTDGDQLRHARDIADARRVKAPGDQPARFYVAEPGFTITGAFADHRLRVQGGRIREVLTALAQRITGSTGLPAGAESLAPFGDVAGIDAAWLDAAAADLVAAGPRGVVVVGERQPPEVHALAHLVNASLGAVGTTVAWSPVAPLDGEGLEPLAAAMRAGSVSTLVLLGVNPAYDAPGDLDFAGLLPKVPFSVHLGLTRDETARLCTWHVPLSHFLESWGDFVTSDGSASVQQPLIAPLHGTLSEIEVLARLVGSDAFDGHEEVRRTWALDDAGWRRALQTGVLDASVAAAALSGVAMPVAAPASLDAGSAGAPTQTSVAAGQPAATDMSETRREGPGDATETTGGTTPLGATPMQEGETVGRPGVATYTWSRLGESLGAARAATPAGVEVDFVLDPRLWDGRYANLGWLQELPDPMTKLTWGNAASLSPATARRLGVVDGDVLRIELGGASAELPAFVLPGMADETVVLPLGGGRRAAGRVGDGVGVDVGPLRTSAAPWFVSGATLTRTGERQKLATTQIHGTLVEPITNVERSDLVRETTAADYAAEPEIIRELEVIEPEHIRSLWEEPNVRTGQQWGMAIDLGSCIGCNACTIACQAENNIPVVGRERVLRGREMHWIRIDRYFRGGEDDAAAVHQPMPCMQCENAPCESVCPVAATAHSPDGLNDMAYNRCIGTRYCSNNCPFKVRRFNWFNFSKENDQSTPLIAMQRNPDVTVRFRGVMEKCTYCTQRIQRAKIDAKVHGDGVVADGTIVPACGQTCPTGAIVFGDVNDPGSAVSRLKSQSRNYAMLAEFNVQPRTTYLARVRNPNPALQPAAARPGHHNQTAPAGEHHG